MLFRRLIGAMLATVIGITSGWAQTGSSGGNGGGVTSSTQGMGSGTATVPGSNSATQDGTNRVFQGDSGVKASTPGAGQVANDPRKVTDPLSRDSGSAKERSVIPPSDNEAADTGTTQNSAN